MASPPPAAGARPAWAGLPRHVHTAVEERAGARVVAARDQRGGFSPGVAARLLLDGGGRLFVKAPAASVNPHSVTLHRAEARTLAALPPQVPAPRLLWAYDDGDWIVLPADLGPWERRYLGRLVALEASWAGHALVHLDLRAGNLILGPDGEVHIVDRAHACAGAPWAGLVLLLTEVDSRAPSGTRSWRRPARPRTGWTRCCARSPECRRHTAGGPPRPACRRSARSSGRMLMRRPTGSPGAPGGTVQFGRWVRHLVGCPIACGRVRSRAPIPST